MNLWKGFMVRTPEWYSGKQPRRTPEWYSGKQPGVNRNGIPTNNPDMCRNILPANQGQRKWVEGGINTNFHPFST